MYPVQPHEHGCTGLVILFVCLHNMKKKNNKKYPAATVAFYGPDDRYASKVVVSIVKNKTANPDPLKKWMSGLTDVRVNEKIGNEIQSFLKEHGVASVIMTDGIIGCPHEEGIDYPEGIKCPLCSFWSNRDRFTHELE